MPPVSEKQRRAMYAAAAGRSTLGIPRAVGREFVASDKGASCRCAKSRRVVAVPESSEG